MKSSTIAKKYDVNLMKFGYRAKSTKWHAYRGGNGTGQPVVEIASAFTLATLVKRIERWLASQ